MNCRRLSRSDTYSLCARTRQIINHRAEGRRTNEQEDDRPQNPKPNPTQPNPVEPDGTGSNLPRSRSGSDLRERGGTDLVGVLGGDEQRVERRRVGRHERPEVIEVLVPHRRRRHGLSSAACPSPCRRGIFGFQFRVTRRCSSLLLRNGQVAIFSGRTAPPRDLGPGMMGFGPTSKPRASPGRRGHHQATPHARLAAEFESAKQLRRCSPMRARHVHY